MPCQASDAPSPNSQPGPTEPQGFIEQPGVVEQPGFSEQPGFNLVPSVALGAVHDSNIFSSASQPQQDYILRLSPGLDTSYLSDQWRIHGDVSFDAERYRWHPDLDSSVAGRHAGLELAYLSLSRLILGVDSGYTTTNNPGGLTLNTTGLVLGRVSARFFTAEPYLSYRFDPLTTGKVSYLYEEDEVEGGLKTQSDTAKFGVLRTLDPRDSLNVDFSDTRYRFAQFGSPSSQALLVGWTHALTESTSLMLQAGPRDTGGNVTPDLTASLLHDLEHGAFTMFYARSQTIVLGEAGPVDTRMAGLSAWYAPTADWEFEATPSYLKDIRGSGHVDVYRLNLGVNHQLGESVYLVSLYQYGRQRGTLDLPSDQVINRTTVYLGLAFYLGNPASVGAAELTRGRPPVPWGT